MHTLANVRKFLDTLFMSDAHETERIQSGLTRAANDRNLLTARNIHDVLGHELAQRYFDWFGEQVQGRRDRTSARTGGEHAGPPS
tara:strand:+ start:265 stop:519 length:255 start_codon:yes stop_codon:yes gene_type:complete